MNRQIHQNQRFTKRYCCATLDLEHGGHSNSVPRAWHGVYGYTLHARDGAAECKEDRG